MLSSLIEHMRGWRPTLAFGRGHCSLRYRAWWGKRRGTERDRWQIVATLPRGPSSRIAQRKGSGSFAIMKCIYARRAEIITRLDVSELIIFSRIPLRRSFVLPTERSICMKIPKLVIGRSWYRLIFVGPVIDVNMTRGIRCTRHCPAEGYHVNQSPDRFIQGR